MNVGQATDDRLTITIHDYYFAQRQDINFHFAPTEQVSYPDEVFMMLNVTVSNVGGGNTSVGSGFQAQLLNGSSYVYPTNFVCNASFSMSPNETIPDFPPEDHGSSIDLSPGAKANFWVISYLSFGPNVVPTNIDKAYNLKLQTVMFRELEYGGDADGYGSFNCQHVACQNIAVEFIIQANASSHQISSS